MAYSEEQKEEIFNNIFNSLENGNSLRRTLSVIDLPAKTFYEWLDADEEKSKQYARSKELGIEARFESIEADYLEKPKVTADGKIDGSWVALQRLKIDSKKWELSKLAPKKYGDKIEVDQNTNHKIEGFSIKDIITFKENVSDK